MLQSSESDDVLQTDALVSNVRLVAVDAQEQEQTEQEISQHQPRVSFVHQHQEHHEATPESRRFTWRKKRSMSDGRIVVRETTTHREDVVSAWTTESNTPMTSQPHFIFFRDRVRGRNGSSGITASSSSSSLDDVHHPAAAAHDDDNVHASLVRFRSKSLGSSYDNLPLLIHDVNVRKQGPITDNVLRLAPGAEELEDTGKSEDHAADVSSSHHHHHHQPRIPKPQYELASSLSSTSATTTTTTPTTPFWICVMYGLINATIVIPIVISFTSIIYRDRAFANYMPTLVKLVVISGMMHQVCFSTLSSLPFCVGSVQDAGLIFLSSMASDIVAHCRQHGYSDDVMLATTTISLPLCAVLLGVALVVLGRLKLAQYVQMLPTCVVGGYLAYIGWFCGMAGISLMIPPSTKTLTISKTSASDNSSYINDETGTGGQSTSSSSDLSLVVALENWEFICPGVIGGILLYLAVRRLKHMAVLPCSIAFLVLVFYIVVFIRGTSVAEVTQKGWIRAGDNVSADDRCTEDCDAPAATHDLWHTWRYLRFDLVAWMALPRLLWTEISMIFVVALSSSLDVAAIEIEMGRDLDFNRELQTVGWSNIVSGCTGGYTGSYIFSQSIFSLRAGIRSRVAGYVLAGAQLLFLILPFNLLAFVPNFFFGSLLVMICVDLVYEWLWDVRNKVSPVEYFVCLVRIELAASSSFENTQLVLTQCISLVLFLFLSHFAANFCWHSAHNS
jgi:MFS superfamily sulfate permease-like transporter